MACAPHDRLTPLLLDIARCQPGLHLLLLGGEAMVAANREFAQKYPVASRRALRAIIKGRQTRCPNWFQSRQVHGFVLPFRISIAKLPVALAEMPLSHPDPNPIGDRAFVSTTNLGRPTVLGIDVPPRSACVA
jgi:hypothetical protein